MNLNNVGLTSKKGGAFNILYKGDLIKKEDTYLKRLVQ